MTTDDYLPRLGDDYSSDLQRVDTEDDYTGESTGTEWVDNSDGLHTRKPHADRVRVAEAMSDLLDSGHGFTVSTVTRDDTKDVQTKCLYCGQRMPQRAKQWSCEFERHPWAECCCNWCIQRRQWENREFRDRGRPRIQCGTAACKREAAAARKRRSRLVAA
jgi:hypothetical protein